MNDFLVSPLQRPKTSSEARRIKQSVLARLKCPYLASSESTGEYLRRISIASMIPPFCDNDFKLELLEGCKLSVSQVVYNFNVLKYRALSIGASILRTPEQSQALARINVQKQQHLLEHENYLRHSRKQQQEERRDEKARLTNQSEMSLLLQLHRVQSFALTAVELDVNNILDGRTLGRSALENGFDLLLTSSDDEK